MKAGITLEEALERAPKWLMAKIEHSVDLLRKAEKLALMYDSEDGFFLAFSGGKDSQALYHVAELAGVRFKAHMNFTSVDPPQVIRFVRRNYPEVVTHPPKWSIYDRAVQRGILPSMRIRWCCADFKETAGAGKVTLIGIRKSESVRRSKRHEVEVSSKKFSGNIDDFAKWQEEEIKRKEEKLLRKMKREGKKVNEDYFTANKEHEVRCISGKDSILVSPVFEWEEKDVWTFLNDVVRVPHCELYDKGYKRIGCILCPMSQHRQKMRELKDFPHVKHRWLEAIKAIRRGGGKLRTDSSGGTSRAMEQRGMSAECSATGNGVNRMGEHQETPQRIYGGNRTDSNAVHRFGSRYGMEFYNTQFTPPIQKGKGVTGVHSATINGSGTTGELPPHTRRKLWKLKQLPQHPTIKEWDMRTENQQRHLGGFSDSPSLNGCRGGKTSSQKMR